MSEIVLRARRITHGSQRSMDLTISVVQWDEVELRGNVSTVFYYHPYTTCTQCSKCNKCTQISESGMEWDDAEMCLQYFITTPTQLVHHVTNVTNVLKGHTHRSITQDTT
jgi:hypothetical protein